MSTTKGLQLIKFLTEAIKTSKEFDAILRKVVLTSAGNGKCTAEFTVDTEHLNRAGTLHGGFTATIIDNVTTFALISDDSSPKPGATIDLHVSYLKAARTGDEILVEANTVKCGKTLAYLECLLKHKKDGSIIAKGTQTKYVA